MIHGDLFVSFLKHNNSLFASLDIAGIPYSGITVLLVFILFLLIIFSSSTAKKTREDAAPTIKNSLRLKDSV